jgi:methyl-accepting chemotaxis protein
VSSRPIGELINRISDIAEGIAAAMEARTDITDDERAKLVRFADALQEVMEAARALNPPQGKPS